MGEADGLPDPTLFKDTVGQRLKAARERAGLDLNDVASRTRVPLRHLKSIEVSDYSQMPSATYSVGFVKSYARAVGLDDAELGRDLRLELGSLSPLDAANTKSYEPVDPKRIAPKWLAVTAAGLALVLFGGYMMWRHQSANDVVPSVVEQVPIAGVADNAALGPVNTAMTAPGLSAGNTLIGNAAAPPVAGTSATPSLAPPAGGSVVLTARNPVWLRIYDANDKVLLEKEMKAGESYTVPADANNPQIRTGAADMIAVTVAGKPVPPLGTAQHIIKNVGVSAAALLARTPVATAPLPATPK